MSAITEPIILDKTAMNIVAELRGIREALQKDSASVCYGMHIQGDGNESDPDSIITYIDNTIGMTPAHMNYSTGKFDYGSWGGAFFMPRPCILKQNGEVQAYLNPDDYEKDIYGNTVTIDSTLTEANVMIEFPKIWLKIVPENDPRNANVYISNKKLDDNFYDYAYISRNKIHKEHFYMPAYNGSYIDDIMRSLSNMQVGKSQNAATEVSRAEANGIGWYTEIASQVMLINFLLLLMARTTDTKKAYGQGLHTGGSEAINDAFRSGVHNTKGLFYGTNSGTISSTDFSNAVKVFGIENWWGFQWRRYAGDILDAANGIKVKMCWGQEDGSTTDDFNTTGSGYIATNAIPSGISGQYIKEMLFTKHGMFSTVNQSNSSLYFTSGQWFNTSQIDYAIRGGVSHDGLLVCALCVHRNGAPGVAGWRIGAALSFV